MNMCLPSILELKVLNFCPTSLSFFFLIANTLFKLV